MSFLKKLFQTTQRHYSGINRHFWIFTYCPDAHSVGPTAAYNTGANDGDGGDSSPYLILGIGKKRLLVEMPLLVKPYKEKVSLKGICSEEELKKRGQDFFYNEYPREYGFAFSEDALLVYYGAKTNDSRTDKTACFFLPWKQWRYIGTTYYDSKGEVQCRYDDASNKGKDRWKLKDEVRAKVEKVCFEVKDVDGTVVRVITYMEQMEHRFGDGYFKWLSLFRKPMLSKRIDIEFLSTVGLNKGEWKGGLMGTSCNVLPGELHEDTFKRWIFEEDKKSGRRSVHLKFLHRVDGSNVNVTFDPNDPDPVKTLEEIKGSVMKMSHKTVTEIARKNIC